MISPEIGAVEMALTPTDCAANYGGVWEYLGAGESESPGQQGLKPVSLRKSDPNTTPEDVAPH